jgi:serine/threonine protein kinase
VIADRESADGRPGTRRFGRYELLDRIGEGGMGVVWRAFAPDGQQVAVKVLRTHLAADPNLRMRFEREVTTLSRIRGRHIAEVIEADVDSDLPYLVTRYVDGPSLHEVVDENGPLRGPALKTLALGLLDALESIHAAGVVHRDLKPGNVLLEDGEPRVIDFGIAQLTHDVRLTMTGMVFGTPGYLAPELLTGADPTPAVDVHSWGATLAFAATGRAPFGRGALEAVALAVMQRQPDLAGVDRWLGPALAAAMAKDPSDRPSSAELIDWFSSGRFGTGDHALVSGPLVSADTLTGATTSPTGNPAWLGPASVAAPVPASVVVEQIRPDTAWAAPSPGFTTAGPHTSALPQVPTSPTRSDALDRRQEPGQPGLHPTPDAGDAPRRVGFRHLSPVVVSWWFAWACVAAAAPVVGLAGMVGWVTVAHATTSAGRQLRKRTDRGRGANGLVVGLSSPWHVTRGAGLAAVGVGIGAVVAGCLLVSLLVLARLAGVTGMPFDVLLFGIGAVAGLYAWHGLGGESTRSGTLAATRRLTKVRYGRVALSALGLLLGVGALYFASATNVTFFPLPIDGAGLISRWTHWFGG